MARLIPLEEPKKSKLIPIDKPIPISAKKRLIPIDEPSFISKAGEYVKEKVSGVTEGISDIIEPLVTGYKYEDLRREQFDVSKATPEELFAEFNRRSDPMQILDRIDPYFAETKQRLIKTLEPEPIPGEPVLTAAKAAAPMVAQAAVSLAPLTPKELRNYYIGIKGLKVMGAGISAGASVGKDILTKSKAGQQVLKTLSKIPEYYKKYSSIDVFDSPIVRKFFRKKTKPKLEGILTENLDDVYYRNRLDIIKPQAKGKIYTAEEFKERGFIKTVKESEQVAEQIKKGVAGEYKVRSTKELQKWAQGIVKEDPQHLAPHIAEQLDDKGVAVAIELIKHYQKTGNDEAAIRLVNNLAPKLTEMGRAIQAVTLLNKLSPEGILRYAQKTITRARIKRPNLKLPDITSRQAKAFRLKAQAIRGMPNSIEKQITMSDLINDIDSLVPDPMAKQYLSIWRAGLLTGLKTHGVNTSSNMIHAGMEIVSKAPATAVDSVVSLFTGKRSTAFTVKNFLSGMGEGTDKAWRLLKTGYDERNVLTKYDYKKVHFGKGKISQMLQKYEESIFRALGAGDQPWYYGAKARSIYEQAKVAGINNKLKGKELTKFIDDLVSNPTDDIVKNAVNDAQVAVYQNKTVLGSLGSQVQKAGTLGEFVVPFSRTPASVAMETINYSPFGFAKTIISNIGKGRFNQRDFSNMAGKNITGTGIFYIGAKLREKGMINLGYPKTEKERQLWQLEGRIANSVKIGNRWININALGPLGYTLVLGGYYNDYVNESGSPTDAFAKTVTALPKTLVDQTYLQNISSIVKGMEDPGRWGTSLLNNLVASHVPTIIGDIAKAKDPYIRDTKRPGLGKSISAAVRAKVPFMREQLPVKITAFGEAVKKDLPPLVSMVDLFRSRKETVDDPTVRELRRLSENDENATPSPVKQKAKILDTEFDITPEERSILNASIGKKIKEHYDKLITSRNYERMDNKLKGTLLRQLSNDIKSVDVLKYALRKGFVSRPQLEYLAVNNMTNSQRSYFFGNEPYTIPIKVGEDIKGAWLGK